MLFEGSSMSMLVPRGSIDGEINWEDGI